VAGAVRAIRPDCHQISCSAPDSGRWLGLTKAEVTAAAKSLHFMQCSASSGPVQIIKGRRKW
jgi:hypothetical protein